MSAQLETDPLINRLITNYPSGLSNPPFPLAWPGLGPDHLHPPGLNTLVLVTRVFTRYLTLTLSPLTLTLTNPNPLTLTLTLTPLTLTLTNPKPPNPNP